MNRVILMGRLTADPELRQTPQGTAVAQFTIAVDRRYSNNGSADFIRCIAWQKTAEHIKRYYHKGKMIMLEGRLQIRNYEDKNGQKRTAAEVIVDNTEFCGDRQTSPDAGYQPSYNDTQGGYPYNGSSKNYSTRPKQEKINFNGLNDQFSSGFEEVDDDEASEDDLPF